MAGRDRVYRRVAVPDARRSGDDTVCDRSHRGPNDQAAKKQRSKRPTHRLRRVVELRNVLLGQSSPRFDPLPEIIPFDRHLNPSQIEAIRLALSAKDVAVMHGPPGTGKTTTLAELVRQAVARGERVLVCAPSNLAVDNLLERLIDGGLDAVRLGHPARVLPAVLSHTLDAVVERHPAVKQARKLVKEASALFRQADRYTRAKPEPGAKRAMRQEARGLMSDAFHIEKQVVSAVIRDAAVVCSTLTGLDEILLRDRAFDLLVIDEAGQGIEPAAWIGLLRCRRVVLAGDHCQLPPTVLSPEAARQGLSVSLLERVVAMDPEIARLLTVQYGCTKRSDLSAREFYGGALTADESVRGHRLCDLPGVAPNPLTEQPIAFVDTAGAGYDEETEEDGESRRNPQEATLVAQKVRELLASGVRPEDVAVISPYAGQVRLLRERSRPEL